MSLVERGQQAIEHVVQVFARIVAAGLGAFDQRVGGGGTAVLGAGKESVPTWSRWTFAMGSRSRWRRAKVRIGRTDAPTIALENYCFTALRSTDWTAPAQHTVASIG